VDVFVLGRKQTVPDEVRLVGRGQGGPARPRCPGPRAGRGPASPRAGHLEDRDPPGLRGDDDRPRSHRPGPGRRPDAPVAVDLVVDKLEHQVERLKGKLVGRPIPPPPLEAGLPAPEGPRLPGVSRAPDAPNAWSAMGRR
jgi:hypothetical protein